MWTAKTGRALLRGAKPVAGITQNRSAYVFERYHPLKATSDPHPNARRQDLLLRHLPQDLARTYQVVEEEQAPQPVKVIALKNTDDFGKRGQVVTVDDPRKARDDLLLPGLGVYATPENLDKFKDFIIPEENFAYSSQNVKDMMREFSRLVLPVTVHIRNPWKLEAWHMRVCFRRLQWNVEADSIQMPPDPIEGPNLDLEGREFYIWVTINGVDRVPIRCVLHHWSPDPDENASLKTVGWMHQFHEPVFEKDREFLARMKRPEFFGPKAAKVEYNQQHLKRYKEWKKHRIDQLQEEFPSQTATTTETTQE